MDRSLGVRGMGQVEKGEGRRARNGREGFGVVEAELARVPRRTRVVF
jgi:hypothetical protein